MNIILSLKTSPKGNYETEVGNENEPILNYIDKVKKHSSIKVIKSRKKEKQNHVCYKEVLNEIRKLKTATTMQQNDFQTEILKENYEVFARSFQKNIIFVLSTRFSSLI